MIEILDSKLISLCLINDYSIIADLYIFVYGRSESTSISLECTKLNLLMLNNFDLDRIFPYKFRCFVTEADSSTIFWVSFQIINIRRSFSIVHLSEMEAHSANNH